jgi:hypothetical protein
MIIYKTYKHIYIYIYIYIYIIYIVNNARRSINHRKKSDHP